MVLKNFFFKLIFGSHDLFWIFFFFYLPANFTPKIINHYELEIDWSKIQQTTPFLRDVIFF